MRRFLIKIVLFSLPVCTLLVGVCFMADGYTDQFYLRFTTPTQKNLIVGTSRAAQALQPDVFEDVLGVETFNYSFTVAHSPYGKVYLESIKKKHNKKEDGIFIVAVDPWSISSWCDDPNDISQFRENELLVANTSNVSQYPNFEYLYEQLKGHYKDIVVAPSKKLLLHKNGWLEVKEIAMDSVSVRDRISRKVKMYTEVYVPRTNFSQVRLHYLLKTIEYFKKYGKVYLVRLPVHSSMMEIENDIMPNFSDLIGEAIIASDDYLDLTPHNDEFQYTDGNHLYKASGEIVSEKIAKWIRE
jgi:hypothetical protein